MSTACSAMQVGLYAIVSKQRMLDESALRLHGFR